MLWVSPFHSFIACHFTRSSAVCRMSSFDFRSRHMHITHPHIHGAPTQEAKLRRKYTFEMEKEIVGMYSIPNHNAYCTFALELVSEFDTLFWWMVVRMRRRGGGVCPVSHFIWAHNATHNALESHILFRKREGTGNDVERMRFDPKWAVNERLAANGWQTHNKSMTRPRDVTAFKFTSHLFSNEFYLFFQLFSTISHDNYKICCILLYIVWCLAQPDVHRKSINHAVFGRHATPRYSRMPSVSGERSRQSCGK